ncbi:MAG: TVP38/TMEM64 family protein [Planctomycetes bacterium]|nr:TVP38/TMEM64 family protein [Planctomycetota bacterium]
MPEGNRPDMETASNPAVALAPARSRGKWIARAILLLAAIVLLVLLGRRGAALVPPFREWVVGLGFWGPVAFVAGYTLCTVAFIPGSALTLAAGAIFGLVEGTIVVFLAAVCGSSAAFLVSRYLARRAIERKLAGNPRFAAIDRAVAKEGRKIVLLLRLSPVFPFNLLNYALGLTGVRFRDYLVGSIGMIPGTFFFVFTGRVVGDVSAASSGGMASKGAGYWALLGAGLAATLLVSTLVARIAKRALTQANAA